MKKKLIILSGFVVTAVPFLALAQITTTGAATNCSTVVTGGGTLFNLICKFGQLLNAIIPVLVALGVVYFIWGVITYVISDDEEAKKSGRNRIIYGIIGLAVIIGLWGLVKILTNTFGLSNSGQIELPSVPTGINP